MKPIASRPSFIAPMQALAVERLPEGDWLYEVKLDGYRALAFKDGKDVRLVSRNNKPFNYPQRTDALKLLPADQVILDSEIVALDEKGRSSFQLLQVFKSSEQRVPLVYFVFDVLFLEVKTCAMNRSRPGASYSPRCSRKRLKTPGFPKNCRVPRTSRSGSPKSSASKAWLPSDSTRTTKAAGAAGRGSR
jgi:ATP dependent DNA ligase-like protein